MDMNDILNQWDKMKAAEKSKTKQPQNQVSHKKANAPTKEEKLIAKAKKDELNFEQQIKTQNERKVNPMEQWLRIYGTIDKDKIAEEREQKSNLQNRNYLINMKPEAQLDLHGLHHDEAYERLNYFIGECVRRNLKKVLVIHGKGNHTSVQTQF